VPTICRATTHLGPFRSSSSSTERAGRAPPCCSGGARSPSECLLLQLCALKDHPACALATEIAGKHLQLLASRDYVRLRSLTGAQEDALRGILAGRLNKQMAFDLQLSERTIKSCRADVMRKLGARSLAELVRVGAPLLRE